jgi:hypothetical protein
MAYPNDGWIPDEDEGYEEMDENGEMVNQAHNPYYLDLLAQQQHLAQQQAQAQAQLAQLQAGIDRVYPAIVHRNDLRQLQDRMIDINHSIPGIIEQQQLGNNLPIQDTLQRLHHYRDTLRQNLLSRAYVFDPAGARLLYGNIIAMIQELENPI